MAISHRLTFLQIHLHFGEGHQIFQQFITKNTGHGNLRNNDIEMIKSTQIDLTLSLCLNILLLILISAMKPCTYTIHSHQLLTSTNRSSYAKFLATYCMERSLTICGFRQTWTEHSFESDFLPKQLVDALHLSPRLHRDQAIKMLIEQVW